jgi:hypothetical protein
MKLVRLSSLKSYLSTYINVITIFPALLLFLFASEISFISQNSLTLRKLCVSIFNQTACETFIFKNKTYENQLEILSNEWNLYYNIAFFIPAIISVLYLVSDADRKSNYKSFMLVSLAGFIIYSIICSIAATQDPQLCLYLILLAQILNGVFGGGSLAFITSCFSYVSIKDDNKFENNSNGLDSKYSNRSIKYSILESAILFGRFLGSISSGYIISNRGNFVYYRNAFLISFSIFLFLFFYKIILFHFIKNDEKISIGNKNFSYSHNQLTTNEEFQQNDDFVHNEKIAPLKIGFKSILVEKCFYIADIWKVLIKKRENNIRFYFLMFLFIYFLTSLISFGVGAIDYLFLTKIPISLKQSEYGLFRAFNTLFKAIALLALMPILKNYFHVPDYILFLIGLISDTANYIVFSISSTFKDVIWTSKFFFFINHTKVLINDFFKVL